MRLKLLALAALFLPLPLVADSISTFSLSTVEHGKVGLPTENVIVTVDLATNDKTATVTFDAAPTFYMDWVFLNVNGTYAISSIIGTQGSQYASVGGGSFDSFGEMTSEVTPTNGKPSTEIIVTLDATGSNSWTSADSVLTPTTDFGKSFYPRGFDAIATVGTSPTSGSADNLGIAGAVAATPEPESLLLVGTGLLSAAGFFRRKFLRA